MDLYDIAHPEFGYRNHRRSRPSNDGRDALRSTDILRLDLNFSKAAERPYEAPRQEEHRTDLGPFLRML